MVLERAPRPDPWRARQCRGRAHYVTIHVCTMMPSSLRGMAVRCEASFAAHMYTPMKWRGALSFPQQEEPELRSEARRSEPRRCFDLVRLVFQTTGRRHQPAAVQYIVTRVSMLIVNRKRSVRLTTITLRETSLQKTLISVWRTCEACSHRG